MNENATRNDMQIEQIRGRYECVANRDDIRICRLIKTDVAVADLHKSEIATLRVQTRPVPAHAIHFRKSAAVDPIIIKIVKSLIDDVLFLLCHFSSVLLLSRLITGKASLYSSYSHQWSLLTRKDGLF